MLCNLASEFLLNTRQVTFALIGNNPLAQNFEADEGTAQDA
jgi:hypothetical protein